jgi:outer membrane protein TolC
VPDSLMSSIDAAVARVTAQGLANADAPSATSQTSARRLREALHALVGLRLSLFPATLTTPTPPEPEAAA